MRVNGRVDYTVRIDDEKGYVIYRETDGKIVGYANTVAKARLKIAEVDGINLDEIKQDRADGLGIVARFHVGSDYHDDPTGARPW